MIERSGGRMKRVKTGVEGIDRMLSGGIPRGFLVCVSGEPGTGKTVFCLHFAWAGIRSGEKAIYVTTEESSSSIIEQAYQFNMDFKLAVDGGMLILIDTFGRGEWTLSTLSVEDLVRKIVEAKKRLGRGEARCIIDSLSAFWLDKPAMARNYSYYIKKTLAPWKLTTLAVTQYAVTTSQAFGFGLEHVSDGIIRFMRAVRRGVLQRYVLIEKMRNTPHDLRLHRVDIVDGVGMVVTPLKEPLRREDVALPREVAERIIEAKARREAEIP